MMTSLTSRNVFLSSLLVLATTLSVWSFILFNSKQHLPSSTLLSKPDAFMEDVSATFMNKDGVPALKIKSAKMTHYPENDTTRAVSPLVTIYRRSPEPWYIRSDSATLTSGIKKIAFLGNVVIHHLPDTDTPLTTLNTASLTVFPEQETAETHEAVTIKQPDTTVNAVGMLANLGDGTVKLLSNAKGNYEPKF